MVAPLCNLLLYVSKIEDNIATLSDLNQMNQSQEDKQVLITRISNQNISVFTLNHIWCIDSSNNILFVLLIYRQYHFLG